MLPPQAIQDAPDLLLGLDLYYDAFSELRTCCGAMGGAIPWTAIVQYTDRLGIKDGAGFDRFIYLIRQMEHELEDYKENKDKGNG